VSEVSEVMQSESEVQNVLHGVVLPGKYNFAHADQIVVAPKPFV